MDTDFINSENIKTSDPHKVMLNFAMKINLRRSDNYVALSNVSIQYTWKNIKKSYQSNKFKLPGTTWDKEFELVDGSYSVSFIP